MKSNYHFFESTVAMTSKGTTFQNRLKMPTFPSFCLVLTIMK